MPDTKRLSTKSETAWSIQISSSLTFRSLLIVCSLLSVRAIWLCPIGAFPCILITLLIFFAATRLWQQDGEPRYLHCDQEQQFTYCDDHTHWHGTLGSGGFRTSQLAIVVIQPEQGLARFVAIWRDAVSADSFSTTHILLYTTASRSAN